MPAISASTEETQSREPLDVDTLGWRIERSIAVPGMTAQIRACHWSKPATFAATSNQVCFTRLLSDENDAKPVQWKIPGSRRFITIGPVGVTPAETRVEVRRRPEKVRAFVLLVEPPTFEQITGLGCDWFDEKLLLRLNRERFSIIRLLSEIAEELAHPGGPESARLVEALATTFLVRFGRFAREEADRATSGLSSWQLQRVCELIQTRPSNKVHVDMLAQACGISPRHLMRGFKQATGSTVHQYVSQWRMGRTKLLLSTTQLSLETIAAEVGFSSASHLSSSFIREAGIAPSTFRQQTAPASEGAV